MHIVSGDGSEGSLEMAGGSNILKEFLVKISFAQDEQKKRNFLKTIQDISKVSVEVTKSFAGMAKGFMGFAGTAAVATTALGAAMTAIAKPLEGLYWAAQRTGANAKELDEFSYAASQVGVSAEAAQSAIEGLAAARRTNPGLNGILAGMGIDPKQMDNAQVMVQLLTKLQSMPHYQGAQIAGMFGLDEKTFNQLENNGPDFQKYLKQREDMLRKSGVDPDKMAKESLGFMRGKNKMSRELLDVTQNTAVSQMPKGEKAMGWIDGAIEGFQHLDQVTNGWSTTVLATLLALKAFKSTSSFLGKLFGGAGGGAAAAEAGGSILKGGLGFVGKMLGRGGGAAAGEAVGGAEAAAGGGGILSTLISLPAIVAGVLGYIAVSQSAAESIRKMLGMPEKITGTMVKDAAANAWKATGIPQAAASLNQQVHAAGGWMKTLSLTAGPIGNLTRMVASFEGHVKGGYGVYKDIAGHLTAGYGHLVRQGEDFSHMDKAGALALLGKDLQAAMVSVAKLVKVHLSKNQADALADFVFNLGGGNLAKSTLLKKLNSGDFAGAADQFQYWNKAMQGGHLVANAGLASRRAAEAGLFRTPDKSVVLNQKTEIHVTGDGASDTGREVARQQGRVNADLARNFAPAVQ
jgi:GH24 family phage-related lysozyme (muramidase)